jgi:hypothetical protein
MESRIYKFIQRAPTLTLLGLRKQPFNPNMRFYDACVLEVADSNKAYVARLLEYDLFPNVRTIHYYKAIEQPIVGWCDNATYTHYLNKYIHDGYMQWVDDTYEHVMRTNREDSHIRYRPVAYRRDDPLK